MLGLIAGLRAGVGAAAEDASSVLASAAGTGELVEPASIGVGLGVGVGQGGTVFSQRCRDAFGTPISASSSVQRACHLSKSGALRFSSAEPGKTR